MFLYLSRKTILRSHVIAQLSHTGVKVGIYVLDIKITILFHRKNFPGFQQFQPYKWILRPLSIVNNGRKYYVIVQNRI